MASQTCRKDALLEEAFGFLLGIKGPEEVLNRCKNLSLLP